MTHERLVPKLFLVLAVTVLWSTLAQAYPQYSVTRDTGYCADCHGNFRTSPYASFSDGVGWGTSLHNGHRSTMLSSDCSTCHSGAFFPVILKSSTGGIGFDPVGCLGCHGRDAGNGVTGTGLRQHHFNAGIPGCASCHPDSDPANGAAVGEDRNPPYYFTPDPNHPNKPTQPCNGDALESLVAPPLGLDNDGDLLYDLNDPDCQATSLKSSTWGRIKTIYR